MCLICCWRKLIFFLFFFFFSAPHLLLTEFSEHLQYPQMGINCIPKILLRPGFNRTFIQSDQVLPNQQLWRRFICKPLWDQFPRLDFCGNGPAGNTTSSFMTFSSLGSPPETKIRYHLYSVKVDTELIFKERKWWIPLNIWRWILLITWCAQISRNCRKNTISCHFPWVLLRFAHQAFEGLQPGK